MMKILILTSLVAMSSCGQKSSENLYPISEESLPRFVNQKGLPQYPNLTIDKSIINHAYPIQIALYKDNQFYYDLPNLGDGRGTWKNNNGILELKAKRSLFDMYIQVKASDKTADSLTIQFSDRFGPTTLKMTNLNLY